MNGCSPGARRPALLGELGILDEQRGRVDAHAGHAAVEPEAQDVLVLEPDVGMRPVEVGLLGREQVQVPLAGRAVGVRRARPGRTAEDRLPAVRRQLAVRRRCPGRNQKRVALGRAGRGAQRRLEPRVLVGDVVRDDVDDRADAELARLGDQLLGLLERPEARVDRAVVRDVVAGVGHRRRVPGVEPERVDAELAQVGQALEHAGEIADPVAVRVGEAAHVDLVDDGVAPPARIAPRRRAQRGSVPTAGVRRGSKAPRRELRTSDYRMQEIDNTLQISNLQ